jgi:hypothetical protein
MLFSFLFSSGMYNLKTLSFKNQISKVKLYFPNYADETSTSPKNLIDGIYEYFPFVNVSHNTRWPEVGHCMRQVRFHFVKYQVAFNLPSFFLHVGDGRGSYTTPPYPDPVPDFTKILFGRHIVHQVAVKLGLIDKGVSFILIPKGFKRIPKFSSPMEAAHWMSKMERKKLWPKLNDYLSINEPLPNTTFGISESIPAKGRSTHILFVDRASKNNREMFNWVEFRSVLSNELRSRGYSFQFINPGNMTLEEQVLVSQFIF